MPTYSPRFSRAAAEAIIAALTSAYGTYLANNSSVRYPRAVSAGLFAFASNLGLLDLLEEAVDAAGRAFLENELRAPTRKNPRTQSPPRFSRAAAEGLISALSSAYGTYLANHRVPFPQAISRGLFSFARELGLTDLLDLAINVAGRAFMENELILSRWRHRAGNPPCVMCVPCRKNSAFYIKSPVRRGGWICCRTPGCPQSGPIETAHRPPTARLTLSRYF